MQTVVTVSLVVKGDPEEAKRYTQSRLAAWFQEPPIRCPEGGFPRGTLLHFGIKSAHGIIEEVRA